MQKIFTVLAILAVVCMPHVYASRVYLYAITLFKDLEKGGIPDVVLLCDIGKPNEVKLFLGAVVDEQKTVIYNKAPILLDSNFVSAKRNTCLLVEGDGPADPDREDNKDDIIGSFVYRKSDFVDGIAYFANNVAEVFLICDDC